MRLVVLASGRGSNLRAIIDAIDTGELDASVSGVFSDKPTAPALAIGRAADIETSALDPRAYPTRAAFDDALFDRVSAMAPDLVVLAGYMRIISEAALAPWVGRMVNIHPSLLPDHPGLDTHRRALEAGDARHGASVHYVTPTLDGGPVLAQTSITIGADDTPTSLARRLLPLEHRLYVATLVLMSGGKLCWRDGGAQLDGHPLTHPLQHDGQSAFID